MSEKGKAVRGKYTSHLSVPRRLCLPRALRGDQWKCLGWVVFFLGNLKVGSSGRHRGTCIPGVLVIHDIKHIQEKLLSVQVFSQVYWKMK